MIPLNLTYALISNGFIIVFNLLAASTLLLSFLNTRKVYFALAAAAGTVAALRQIPGFYLGIHPESIITFQFSLFIQFAASLLLLAAFLHKSRGLGLQGILLVGISICFYIASTVHLYISSWPQTYEAWILVYSPIIISATFIVWIVLRTELWQSSSTLFLFCIGISLLALRIWIPLTPASEIFDLVYFMEALCFPMLLVALCLVDVEEAYKNVKGLLIARSRSEQDIQFVLDNSLDVIISVDEVGMILSWNKRALGKFGYTAEQAIGKIHIDELFSDNYWHQNKSELVNFVSKMEHIEGKSFNVNVRMKSVTDKKRTYSIYVLSDVSDAKKQADTLPIS